MRFMGLLSGVWVLAAAACGGVDAADPLFGPNRYEAITTGTGGGASSSASTGTGGGHECKAGETLKCECDDVLAEQTCEDGTWSACPCPVVADAGGTGGSLGGKDAGPCVPTKTCADNAQGACADLDDGCGHALDCSQTCGAGPYIVCQGNTCTCQRDAANDAACAGTVGAAYGYGVRCSGNGGAVPGVPADCMPLGSNSFGPSPFWCCGSVM